MTTQIKKFEKMKKIKFKEAEFYLTLDQFEVFKKQMKDPGFIIEIGGNIYNKYNFDGSYDCIEINNILSFILSQPIHIRKKLQEREEEKKKLIGKGFESIDEVNNYIIKHGLI